MPIQEVFKPFPNRRRKNLFGRSLFLLRQLLDFQLLTIYRDIELYAKSARGVLLDIGCGDCPYKHLFTESSQYIGMDVKEAADFDYHSDEKILQFDDTNIAFPDETIDHIVFSEVMEHVAAPEALISEMHRVLKPGGDVFITIPWSARYHYIPHDYARYTPSKLKLLFSAFTIESITPRGNDIAVICNKLIVAMARQIYDGRKIIYTALPFMILLSPLLACIVVWGQCAIWLNLGSIDDPLGYTISLKKTDRKECAEQ